MKKTIWISYDLGIRGDYKGLYTWLDKFGAEECGDSLAVMKVKVTGNIPIALKKTIRKYVKLSPLDRIYIIYKDTTTGKMSSGFLFGKRQRAAWEGYGQTRNIGFQSDVE